MKKAVKIFVDCHVFDGNFQGSTTYIKGLYSEMTKDKTKQFFLAASHIEKLKSIFGTAENITYIQYKSHNKFYRLLFDVPKIIKENQIDFAHFQYVAPPVKYCKYIVTTHDILFMDFPEYFPLAYKVKNKFLFRQSAKAAEIVLTVSEFSRKQLKTHFGIDAVVTPNAVDPVYFEKYDPDQAKQKAHNQFGLRKYWIYVSRREPRKNHLAVLRVFAEKGWHNDYDLVFVGDKAIGNPGYDAYFNALPDQIQSKVKSFYKVSPDNLLTLLRGADLAVYASVAEGFGIPPLEAAAAGIPCVFSGTTAMGDFDFMADFMFDPLSDESINGKIEFALDSPRRDFSKAVRAKYSWEYSADVLSDCLGRTEKVTDKRVF